MKQWETRLQQHPAMQLAVQIATKLDSADTPGEAEELDGLERLKKVANWIRSRMEASDGDLVSPAMLDPANGALTNLSNALDVYLTSHDSAQLANVQTYADAALDAIRGWPIPESALDVKALKASAASYSDATKTLVDGLKEQVAASGKQVEDLAVSIPTAKGELESQLEGVRSGITEASAQLAAEKARLDALISESQKQLLDSQEARRKENEDFLESQKTKFEEALAAHTGSAKKADEDFRAKATAALSHLEDLKGQAEEVVGAIGSTGMTGGFQIYANDQKKQADVLRYGVVVSLALIAIIGGWLLHGVSKPNFSLLQGGAKAFITVPLAAIAAYAGKQSHDHRLNERRARKFELEVAALDPYIALLPEVDRFDIKRKMAEKIFGQPDAVAEFKGVGVAQLEPVITKAIEAAVKAAAAQITRAT